MICFADVIGHDYGAVTKGNVGTQVQAIKLLGILLSSEHFKQLQCHEETTHYLLSTVGRLAMGIQTLLDDDNGILVNVVHGIWLQMFLSFLALLERNSHLPGLSPYASHAGCIAEHLVQVIRCVA